MYTVRSYREWMARFGAMRLMDVWYSGITEQAIRDALSDAVGKRSNSSAGSGAPGRDLQRRQGARHGQGRRQADLDRRRSAGRSRRIRRSSDGSRFPAARRRWRPCFDAYRATMPESLREFLERYRFSDLRAEGCGRRQRGHALLHHRASGPRRGRSPDTAGQGSLHVGARAIRGQERARQPRRTRSPRPASDAGDLGHFPGLVSWPGRSRLLLPPVVGHEGVGRYFDACPAGHGVLWRAVRLGSGGGARPEWRRHRHRRLHGNERHVRWRRWPTSPRRTPT